MARAVFAFCKESCYLREMSKKCIFHVDVNSAFLSWSALKQLKENPGSVDLRTIPSAVGGDIRTRHGVITAKSIPAKKFGVHTGEPVMRALEKCPDLVLVKADFETYHRYSHEFIKILHRYSDEVEQVSIDEAYLDMTEEITSCCRNRTRDMVGKGASGSTLATGKEVRNRDLASGDHADPEWSSVAVQVAHQLKDEVRDHLGFTVNVGISVNKLLAKTASDFEKPDKVHTLWPSEVPEKMWPMPIGSLHGCGRATAARLQGLGINTVGDAAHTDVKILTSLLGEKAGIYIHESANGRGSDVVVSDRGDAKSYSNETTLPEDVSQENFETTGKSVIHYLSEKVSGRLKKDHIFGHVVTFSVKTDDFKRHSRQNMLADATDDAGVIEEMATQLAYELLRKDGTGLFARGRTVRLIGVGVSKLDRGEFRQMNLFDLAEQNKRNEAEKAERTRQEEIRRQKEEKQKRLAEMMQGLNRKYGADTIRKGTGK